MSIVHSSADLPDPSTTEQPQCGTFADRAQQAGCDDCPIARRDFLGEGTLIAVAAVAAIASPRQASGLHARIGSSLGRAGSDVRYAIPPSDGATIDRGNDVIIARVGSAVFALDLACPHQRTAIRWNASDNRFECPKHHSQYSPAGIYLRGRATRSLDRLPNRRDGDQLVVDVDTVYRQDRDRSQWQAAVAQL